MQTMMPPSPLLACCENLVILFAEAGYEVLPPLAMTSVDPDGPRFQINLRNLLGAGGYQEALIELTGLRICRVYAGEIYPRIAPTLPTRPWRRSEFALDSPHLGQVLLRAVRAMLLDEC